MSKIKHLICTIIAGACCVMVLTGGIVCSRQSDSSICSQMDIVVEDSVARQFVRAYELELYLKSRGGYAVGQVMSGVDCHAMEQILLAHDMIRTANCYKTPFGVVCVRVTQRVPVLHVKTQEGNYWVDSDRQIMPVRKGVQVDVPVFTGAVSRRAAVEEYYDFVEWLKDNDYWGKRIKDIHVRHPKYIVLTQNDYSANIVLGQLDNYEAQLMSLKRLYKNGFDVIGYPECRELDLRFEGQVVKR